MQALSSRLFHVCMAVVLLFSSTALPAQQVRDDVRIADAWTRAMPPGVSTAAVYFTVTAKSDDELLRISTPVADDAQIHEVTQANGVMQMRSRGRVLLKAGLPVNFSPRAMHVMLTGVKQSLKAGDHFAMTLTFLHAGMVNIEVRVRSVDSPQ